jgi:uncharacterized protein (TIGR00269 family)
MKCKKCQSKASVELRRHHSAFCSPHYLEFVENQVARNIKRHRMFSNDDRILVAVSGGKDSLALWDLLLRLGYDASGFHIHLGIGEYSRTSVEKTQAFAKLNNASLLEISVEQTFGLNIPDLSNALKRVPCSGCGLNKRYLFNKTALDNGFTVVATGHNLDDESATLLGNVLHWETDSLVRQSPLLASTHPKLVKKVKPLYTLTEREMASYCLIRGIDYVEEECPNAAGAHSLLYKDVLNQIEVEAPGSKQQFFQGLLEKLQPKLQRDPVQLRECSLCGQPTTADVCSFCRTWERALRGRAPSPISQVSRNAKELTQSPTA